MCIISVFSMQCNEYEDDDDDDVIVVGGVEKRL
jgi:hypothetical protein